MSQSSPYSMGTVLVSSDKKQTFSPPIFCDFRRGLGHRSVSWHLSVWQRLL
uniref:Uncharacterized protein n=1 Tax=Arundo donax TaxID=35708 RepID=A0A0A9B0N8_ARUDO